MDEYVADGDPNGSSGVTRTPRPDPTVLTTQQLVREIGTLRELLFEKLAGLKDTTETRFHGMDTAMKLLQAIIDQQFPMTEKALAHQNDLFTERFGTVAERFSSVKTEFSLRDAAALSSSQESKANVKDALAAQEKNTAAANKSASDAVAKAEDQTTKQIDSIKSLVQAGTKATDDRATETRDRLTRLEGLVTAQIAALAVAQQNQQTGISDRRADQTQHQSSSSFTLALVMSAVTLLNVLIGVGLHFLK